MMHSMSGSGMRLLHATHVVGNLMVDAERDGAEMVEPAAKRLCSTVASVVRRVAVEGNIGEREREGGKY